jgi:hypothetical protein
MNEQTSNTKSKFSAQKHWIKALKEGVNTHFDTIRGLQILQFRIHPFTYFLGASQSQSHIATDGRSVSLSVLVSSPVWGSRPDISYCLTVTVLSLGGRPL